MTKTFSFPDTIFFHDLSGKKPTIACSACLMGDKVRYDGKDKHFDFLSPLFSSKVNFVKICPEVGAGMSTPRPPIQVISLNGIKKLEGANDKSLDPTEAVVTFAEDISKKHRGQFQAYLLKARSPSCGIHSTPIFNKNNEIDHVGKGLYTDIISQRWQDVILVEEEDIITEDAQKDFLFRVYCLLDIDLLGSKGSDLLLKHYQQLLEKDFENIEELREFITTKDNCWPRIKQPE